MSDIKNEKFRSVSDQVEVYKFRIETLEQVELFQRNEITSLITTIESQKTIISQQSEAIKYWQNDAKLSQDCSSRKEAFINSQKEEIEAIKTILKQKIAILDQRVETRKGVPLFDEIPERAESFQDRAALYDEILSLFSQEGDK